MFYFAIKLGVLGTIGWSGFLPGLITTAILVLSILFIMRDERALGIFALPSFVFFLLMNTRQDIELYFLTAILFFIIGINILVIHLMNTRQDLELYFLTAILFFIIGINILVIHQQKVFALRIPEDKFEHLLNWRTFARPLAILFIVLSISGQKQRLYIAGGVAAVFILLDLTRLISERANIALFGWRGFLKQKEKRTFSSMTFFLTAVFLLFLLFPPEVVSISILFVIFGDLAAKFFGVFYSKINF